MEISSIQKENPKWLKSSTSKKSIYGMHEECLEVLKSKGMSEYRRDEAGRCFFFERYNCPRFTEKDDQGNVILDYEIYLA